MFWINKLKDRLQETRNAVNTSTENISILDSNQHEANKLFAIALANLENLMASLSLRDILISKWIWFGVKYVDNLLLQENITYFTHRWWEEDHERVEWTFEHCSEVALEWLDELIDQEELEEVMKELSDAQKQTKTKPSPKAKAKWAKKK